MTHGKQPRPQMVYCNTTETQKAALPLDWPWTRDTFTEIETANTNIEYPPTHTHTHTYMSSILYVKWSGARASIFFLVFQSRGGMST